MRIPDRLASKSSLVALGLTVIALGLADATIDAARPAKHQAALARHVRTAPLVPQVRPAEPDAATQERIREHYGRLPLSFEKNEGQSDRRVEFISRGRGYTMFLTRGGEAVMALSGGGSLDQRTLRLTSGQAVHPGHVVERGRKPRAGTGAVLRLKFAGASQESSAAGAQQLPGKINYLLGKDPKQWRTGISTYARVVYEDLYPGVDLVYYGNQRQLEYDLIVDPGADPRAIAIDIGGAEKLEINAAGDLVMHVRGRQVVQRKPFVYQETRGVRTEIEGRYKLEGRHRVRFQLAAYDRSRPLVIDPTLAYSTYLGGKGDEGGQGVAVDRAGNAYVTGYTLSTDFPTTLGAAYTEAGGGIDAFVTKLNPAGTALVYSTYLGGNSDDRGQGVAVDALGYAYVTGSTSSENFPRSVGAFDTSVDGTDAFVAKLGLEGALEYSTCLGGSGSDSGLGVAIDASGSAYVTGSTTGDFPTSEGAFQTTPGGGFDAFVTKLNASGTALLYSTYLGGSGNDSGLGIAIDSSGNAYVTGPTGSEDFPTRPGAFQTTLKGDLDAFVTKLGPAGTAPLVYSTYVGGTSDDAGQAVAIDATRNAYITGYTFSTDFPTSLVAYDGSANGDADAFVAKLDLTGTTLSYSTYLGGAGSDEGKGVAVGGNGSAYVTGTTVSSDFPATTSPAGSNDAFVTKFDATGTILNYSILLGGRDYDMGAGIAVDAAGSAYVTGSTYSSNFPVTAGAFDTEYNGVGDVFVSKIAEIGTPTTLTLSPVTATNKAGEPHCVIATVKDAAGNPVPGVTVRFSVTGANTTSGSATTDPNGRASFCYRGTAAGTDTITAFADTNNDGIQNPGEPGGAATKTYTPAAPDLIVVTPRADVNPAGVEHCVTATVTDEFGNPTPGINVYFTVTGANVRNGRETTDDNGEAEFCYTGTKAGLDTIKAVVDANGNNTPEANEPTDAVEKTYTAGAPFVLMLSPATGTNPIDTRHCVIATVTDAFGNPTSGVTVTFRVAGAVNTTDSAVTNPAGQATFCYLGPPLPGVDAIRAYADIDGDNTQDAGEPAGAAAKTWTLPASTANCEVAVTMGGRITAANGDKASFGGNAKSDGTGQTSGQQEYQDHGPAQPMNVHSISVLALICDSGRASTSIYGLATIDGEGSYYYRISVSESGNGNTAMDTYSILLQNGYYSGIQVVEGGKIQVR